MLRFILHLHFLKYYGSKYTLATCIQKFRPFGAKLSSEEQFKVSTRMLLPQFIAILSSFSIFFCLDCLKFSLDWAKSLSRYSSTVFLDIIHSLYYIFVARNSKYILGRPANEKKLIFSEKAVDSIPRLDEISHVMNFSILRDLLGLKANDIDRPRN